VHAQRAHREEAARDGGAEAAIVVAREDGPRHASNALVGIESARWLSPAS
jgi:hypothetical protein